MDGTLPESGYDQLSISPSFPHDFSHIALQQASPGGVGTIFSHGTAASSSLASSPEIMTPAPSDCSVSFNTPSSPSISFENPGATPETPHSDQDSDSSSTRGRGPFRCEYRGCKSKKKVFKLKCQLRKHTNNHTRPKDCPYCKIFRGGAEFKDLARHVRTCHADLHEVRNNRMYWKEQASCPRCGREMRADNLRRHLRTCTGTGARASPKPIVGDGSSPGSGSGDGAVGGGR
jgi:hypothetical protein